MKYNIESKQDGFGLSLTVQFPEADLDKKALYTIQADQPDFLVPFRYRSVNGQVECAYQLGSRSLLKFHYEKEYEAIDYIRFWERILQPLVECEDWFLNPFSFVLDTRYLYKDQDKVSYLYIPSRQPYSDMDSLRTMSTELSRENSSKDAKLYSEVLLFTTQNFQPASFLQMLRKNYPPSPIIDNPPDSFDKKREFPPRPVNPRPDSFIPPTKTDSDSGKKSADFREKNIDDIYQNLLGDVKKTNDKKSKLPKDGGSGKGGFFKRLFGKKEDKEKDIFSGAPPIDVYPPRHSPVSKNPSEQELAPVYMPDDQNEETKIEKTKFLLVGRSGLPAVIEINIQPGESFTIGRHNVKAGRKLSNFEFHENTEAVSRKHAAIERTKDGSYVVVDLNSRAGTFVDKERLSPNVPHLLTQGCRVSFGTAGAEYLWEE